MNVRYVSVYCIMSRQDSVSTKRGPKPPVARSSVRRHQSAAEPPVAFWLRRHRPGSRPPRCRLAKCGWRIGEASNPGPPAPGTPVGSERPDTSFNTAPGPKGSQQDSAAGQARPHRRQRPDEGDPEAMEVDRARGWAIDWGA